jgi:ubiquinone/menaquinone biosynthesis C-methylase UbiE
MEIMIEKKENQLREWFTRRKDPVSKVIDGLDIGWGGVQRWATGRMPPIEGLHLDIACGYATFLAQLGWRFPMADLVGLNIDFSGPHRLAGPLLLEADVRATLVRADARRVPFPCNTFNSLSCFLGLQDIEIGFGWSGVRQSIVEAVRVVRERGLMILLDEYPFSQFTEALHNLPVEILDFAEQTVDSRWTQEIAEKAIELYAQGWAAQARHSKGDDQEQTYTQIYQRLQKDLEKQLSSKGYFIPFGPIRMLTLRKTSRK